MRVRWMGLSGLRNSPRSFRKRYLNPCGSGCEGLQRKCRKSGTSVNWTGFLTMLKLKKADEPFSGWNREFFSQKWDLNLKNGSQSPKISIEIQIMGAEMAIIRCEACIFRMKQRNIRN